MEVAPCRRAGHRAGHVLGQVEPGGGHLGGQLGEADLGPPRPRAAPRRWCGPRAAAGPAPCAGLGVQRAERPVRPRPAADFLPEHRGRHVADLLGGGGGGDGRPGLGHQRVDVHRAAVTGSRPSSPGAPGAVIHGRHRRAGRDARPVPAAVRRWRRASKHSTAADTPTLSDSDRPAMGMVTPSVEGRHQVVVQPAGLVAQHQGDRAGPVERGVVGAAPHHGGHRGEPRAAAARRRPSPTSPPSTTGTWKSEPAVARTHLRVGRVDGAVAAHHGVDPGGVGRADHRAEVARVAHVDAHHDQGGAGQGVDRGRRVGRPRPAAAGASPWRRPAP